MISAVVALRFRARGKNQRAETRNPGQRAYTAKLAPEMIELEQSKEAAEAANQAKKWYSGQYDHEFRTPLNAITGIYADHGPRRSV